MSLARLSVRGLALLAVGLLVSACGDAAPRSLASPVRKFAEPMALAAVDTAGPAPHWLPPGAVETASPFHHRSGVEHFTDVYFTLPGRANASKVQQGQSLVSSLAAHPPTGITFRYGPTGSLPVPPVDPVLFVAKVVRVAGSPATVVEQDNSLGDVTLTWRTSETEFQLLTSRLATADGESGVGDDTLVKIADSVH